MKLLVKLLFIVVLMTGCSAEKDKAPSDKDIDNYQVFDNYLNGQFGLSVDTNQHFLIIPGLVCKGCVTHALAHIKVVIKGYEVPRLQIISSNTELVKTDSLLNRRVLWDKEMEIDRLDLPINNATLIEVGSDSTLIFHTSSSKNYQSIGDRLGEIYIEK